ncbi:MAG: hypothetical protein V3S98_10275 [Dehalococcoidia bacterium]
MERAPKKVAKLRRQLINLFRDGLGQECADTRLLDDLLEEQVLEVFKLHIRIETGKSLGMPEGMFVHTGLDQDDDEDEDESEADD